MGDVQRSASPAASGSATGGGGGGGGGGSSTIGAAQMRLDPASLGDVATAPAMMVRVP
jgi:hypothetical protein